MVKVPSTQDDWELYDCPESVAAVLDLNNQVDVLEEQWNAACHGGEMAPTRLGIESARRRLFDPVLLKHAAAGAQDTEPSGCVDDMIRRIAAAFGTV